MPLLLDDQSILEYLNSSVPELLEELLQEAQKYRLEALGNEVYMRGLIEFSNRCTQNCFYCGLRRDNSGLNRYALDQARILELADLAYQEGFQSVALQSGDLAGDQEVIRLADTLCKIKEISSRDGGTGLGITLSVGELDYQQYRLLRESGAERYLLRIESSNPRLFRSLHPPAQSFERRLECLAAIKDNDYQLGTGIMTGLPGQTADDLLADLHFFKNWDIDMLGLGPYIAHPDTPLARSQRPVMMPPLESTLKMMALARLILQDVNMVCSTALQTLDQQGLQLGLKAGANVVMPVLTPEERRGDYSLYANKACKGIKRLSNEVEEAGYRLAYWKLGNSRHYYRVRGVPHPELSVSAAAGGA